MPFYGHRYCLKFGETCNYGAESEGRGAAGPYTGEAGFLAYYEVSLTIIFITLIFIILWYV